MMNSTKLSITKYWLTYIFLFAPFLTNAQFQKADSLMGIEEYEYAAVEYERVVYSNSDPRIVNQALLKEGLCYKELANYKLASSVLGRANLFLEQDSLNYAIRYEIVLNSYLAEDYPNALAQLTQLEYFFKDNGYNKVLFLHILTLNSLRRWEEAKVKYEEYLRENDTQLSVEEAYGFLKKPKIKDPEKAESISYFLPGVGQMYAGYFGRGLLSGFLQAVFIGYGAYSLYEGYFFSGALTGVGLFWAFYSGGSRHAKYLAQKKNEELTVKYNKPIKEALLKLELSK